MQTHPTPRPSPEDIAAAERFVAEDYGPKLCPRYLATHRDRIVHQVAMLEMIGRMGREAAQKRRAAA